MTHQHWTGFAPGPWQDEINLRDFIQRNYTEYTGDEAFLADATPRTKALMERLQALLKEPSPLSRRSCGSRNCPTIRRGRKST